MLLFGDTQEESWGAVLASAEPGTRYRITQLVFVMARDRCHELGLREGDEFTCVDNRRWGVDLARSDGRQVTLERDYARFVQVEPVDGRGASSPTRD